MRSASIFVFILSFVFVQAVQAETPVVSSNTPTRSAPSMDINKTAKGASSLAMVTQVAGAGVAVYMFANCTPTTPMYCALGAAAAAGAVMMGKGSSNAGNVAASVQARPGEIGYVPPDFSNPDGPGFGNGDGGGFVLPEVAAIDSKFRALGFETSADGQSMKLPSGETVSTAALAAGSVPGYEMSDELRAEAQKVAEDALKKASGSNVVAIGLQEGGGGGGSDFGAAPSEEASSKFNMAAYLKSLQNRDPASVTGLSKKLGEDNIGIKSDNIFEMVSRQYKRKQTQRAFMN